MCVVPAHYAFCDFREKNLLILHVVNRFVVVMDSVRAYREIETKFLDISYLEIYIQHVKTILIFFIPCIAFVVIHLSQQILETEIKKSSINLYWLLNLHIQGDLY